VAAGVEHEPAVAQHGLVLHLHVGQGGGTCGVFRYTLSQCLGGKVQGIELADTQVNLLRAHLYGIPLFAVAGFHRYRQLALVLLRQHIENTR